MAKELKVSKKQARQETLRLIQAKANELMGMHVSRDGVADGVVAIATAYSKVDEADTKKMEAYLKLGEAVTNAFGMTSEIVMHERDINTALGLETMYHSGKTEFGNIRKEFKPRKWLKK